MNRLSLSIKLSTQQRAYVWIIKYNVDTGVGILRCGHDSLPQILRAIQESGDRLKEIQMRIWGTSGSIKTLKRKFLSKEFK
jgi:RNase P/RNase MRP subunit POP5